MRLDKLIGALSPHTRKQIHALVKAGRVQVNGATASAPAAPVNPERDCVSLDGRRLGEMRYRHAMIRKPAGVLTAARDRFAPTVMGLIPAARRFDMQPVGRLDKDVTGLLLLTEDGELLHRLISPRYGVEKVYEARVAAALDRHDVEAFAQGIALSDFVARPSRLEITDAGDMSLARLTITEGRFHQVKRMFAARGKPVIALRRVAFAGVALDERLEEGQWRPLTEAETATLYRAARLDGAR